MGIIKGQNLRIFIKEASGTSKAVACATSCAIHVTASTESSATKDDTGDWESQEATGKSWNGSADALVCTDTTAYNAFDIVGLIGQTVTIEFQQTEGEKNRVAVSGGKKLSGTAIINSVDLTAPNKANSTMSVQFLGTGALA